MKSSCVRARNLSYGSAPEHPVMEAGVTIKGLFKLSAQVRLSRFSIFAYYSGSRTNVMKPCLLPPEFAEVRLVKNGTSQCEGQVEVNTSAGWRALCASHWSMTNANVVCHQLGCGVAIATPKGEYFVEEGDEIRKDQFHCSGDEPFLRSCPVIALGVPACAHGNTASVVCTGKTVVRVSS